MKTTLVRLATAGFVTAALLASTANARQVEVDEATVADLNAAFAAGSLTSERLIELCLARIRAYDDAGPKLNAVITLNNNALEEARALDKERKAKGPRSALHGVPVVLKDEFNVIGMPNTAGSLLLEGFVPKTDAYLVKKLKNAGAIILAKVNMGEFANGSLSSLGGQSFNPHDLARTPGGSSSGTGIAIAAGYAPIGLGGDAGGSIRIPAAANGIVGLKTTHGLLGREGIIPLTESFEVPGPMTRTVYDAAAVLGLMTGLDPADPATRKSEGKTLADYTKVLRVDALKGARIGVARDLMGADADVDWVIEAAIATIKRSGATVIDVRFPRWFLESNTDVVYELYPSEFAVQIETYLKTYTGPEYPKTLQQMIARAQKLNNFTEGRRPNTRRWIFMRDVEGKAPPLTDPRYLAIRDQYLPFSRTLTEGVFARDKLDAIIYPSVLQRPGLVAAPPAPPNPMARRGISAPVLANVTGLPDLSVPAGFTAEALPVGLSFLGTAFNEGKILSLGYSFEQAAKAWSRPRHTPALANSKIEVPDRRAD